MPRLRSVRLRRSKRVATAFVGAQLGLVSFWFFAPLRWRPTFQYVRALWSVGLGPEVAGLLRLRVVSMPPGMTGDELLPFPQAQTLTDMLARYTPSGELPSLTTLDIWHCGYLPVTRVANSLRFAGSVYDYRFTMVRVQSILVALLVVFLTPASWLWWRDRSFPPGMCETCGYDLTGNASGHCPECGAAVPSALALTQQSC